MDSRRSLNRLRIPAAAALVLIMGAACSRGQQGGPASTPPSPPTPTLQALAAPQNLSANLERAGGIAAAAPVAGYDVSAKARELGSDVDKVFAFVRDRVRFEVYTGVLRGPRGTLMTLAGNSYDKSALLGALLTAHGFRVRYARARLSEEQAGVLVSRMLAMAAGAPRDPRPPGAQDTAAGVSGGLQEFERAVFARWVASADVVRGALERARARLGDRPAEPAGVLAAEAVDHLYLEYQDGSRWVPLDPAFAGARLGQRFADAIETFEAPPQDRYHRVTIRVRVERRTGDQASTEEVLRYEATAAELYGVEVTLTHRLLSNDPWSAAPIVQVGDEIVTGRKFGDQTVGEIVGGRVLQGLDRQASGVGTVTAVWLEFDFTHPLGQVETVRREVFDRVGLAARQAGDPAAAPLAPLPSVLGIPAPLLQAFGLSVASGIVYPLGDISGHEASIAPVAALLASRSQTGGTVTEEVMWRLVRGLTPVIPTALGALARSFHILSTAALGLSSGSDALIYAASPRLAIVTVGLTVAPDGMTIIPSLSLDLRRNAMRAVARQSSRPGVVWANVRRGLYDGVLEHGLIADLGQGWPGQVAVGPLGVFEEARRRGIDVVAVTDPEGISKLRAADAVKARLREAFGEDVLLVVPAQAVPLNGLERLGWWRIDLRTGETLAVMDTGLHQTGTEQQMQRRQAEATLWALYERNVVRFFGGHPFFEEIARGYAMAFYQMGMHAGAGPSVWPLVISCSGLAAVIAFLLGWYARGSQIPPPPPPPPPPRI
ncbi:MAG: hypothetical protein QN141_03460 [Armatimonadota bacterium]|nr:hypothetical protein [Armatimonadota bacterium]MDR7451401.1 hypothetical protein [Armatimonadota bacterium]MDR7466449.1 hypothetical protein [Armatimonadota bacterium]MDR7493171.1 hypothetical protein [Armatimonadota bacterium]MDR7499476.1 hypothetical protein [Armatimonadota bacterium]